MTTQQQTAENMTKAAQSLAMARDDLRAALQTAGHVEGLAVLDLIAQSAELTRRAEALAQAMQADHTERTATNTTNTNQANP